MSRTARVLAAIAITVSLFALPAAAATDTITFCSSPQRLNAPAAIAVSNGNKAIAWNGRDFGVLTADSNVLRFQRVYADGTVASAPVTVGSTSSWIRMALVWNGSGYGAAWVGYPANRVYFAKLDENGGTLSGPTAMLNGFWNVTSAALATSGSGYLVVWDDARNGARDVFGTLLDANGTITSQSFAIASAINDQQLPTVAWARSGGNYVVVWQDTRNSGHELWASTVSATGVVGTGALVTTAAARYVDAPSLVDAGGGVGLAWREYRDTNYEIYFAVLGAQAQRLSAEFRLSSDVSDSRDPVATWTGGEFGVFFRDKRSGVYDVFMQRVDAAGNPVGGNVQLTSFAAADYTTAAFGTKGYLAVYGSSAANAPTLAVPVGCTSSVSPPCPAALDAYGITGTGATLGWLSAQDLYTDVAYYEVYRNATLVGTTSKTSFSDTGLTANTAYQYNVRTVNAAQLVAGSCPDAQIYVKASSALALGVERTGNDIALAWTDAAGQNAYRVMRGTSPQVMQEIGTTTETKSLDAGAAVGNVCYFYSIDEPAAVSRP